MTEEESVNKITLANYFGGIKRFKWWVLGSTVLGTLIGFLAIRFVVNPAREGLKSEFGYNINVHFASGNDNKTEIDADTVKYLADNSIFNYSDIISETRMTAVKESKDEYKSIDVNAILNSNAIELARDGYTDSTTGKMVYTYPERYTLTVKTKFFVNINQGKSFVKDLIEYQLKVAGDANNSFTVPYYINDSFESLALNARINTLEKQYKSIDNTYSTLYKDFTDNSLVAENLTLGVRYNTFKQSNIDGAFTKYDTLKNEYYQNHYINPTTDTEAVLINRAEEHKNKIKDNLIEINIYNESIQNLIQNTTIITGESKNELQLKILELTEEINDLKLEVYKSANELKNLGYIVPENSEDITLDNVSAIVYNTDAAAVGSIQYVKGVNKPANWEDDCTKFVAKVSSYIGGLKKDADECNSAYHYLYNTYKNKVNFYTTNFAVATGSVNIAIGLIAGLLAGYVISSIVTMAVHINKPVEKKEKK